MPTPTTRHPSSSGTIPDQGTWEAQPEGTLATLGNQRVYTFSARHFSRYRAFLGFHANTFVDTQAYFGVHQTCTPGGCPAGQDCCGNTCCKPQTGRRVHAVVRWGPREVGVTDVSPRCLPLPADTRVTFELWSLQPEVAWTRLYRTRGAIELLTTPAPSAGCKPHDPGTTTDVGPVALVDHDLTCVTGDLWGSTCKWADDPHLPRDVQIVMHDDSLPSGRRHVGTAQAVVCGDPADHADDFCIDLPAGITADLVSPGGSALTVTTEDLGGTDVACPTGPGPFPECQLADGTPAADALVQARLEATITGPAVGGVYPLQLDGTASENALQYVFTVWDRANGRRRVHHASSPTDATSAAALPPGDYLAELRVFGEAFRVDRALRSFELPPIGHPVAAFSLTPWPTAAQGATVTLDATASSDDGTLVSYDWDLGDGRIATGATTTASWGQEDRYVIGLTVTEDHGNSHTWEQPLDVVDGTPTLDVIRIGDGSVISSPLGIECHSGPYSVCSASFAPNTPVGLIAHDGKDCFVSWDSGCPSESTDGPVCAVVMDADLTVTARFGTCP